MRRVFVALPFALLIAACGGEGTETAADAPSATTFPMTVESCGEEVTISERPEKIFAVGPAAVNLIGAAGGADLVIGMAGSHRLPDPNVSGVDAPIISEQSPSTEEIIGSGADMVIHIGLEPGVENAIEQAGITSLVTTGNCDELGGAAEAVTPETIYDNIRTYGKLFGTEDRAARSIAQLQERVETTKSQVAGNPPISAAAVSFYGDQLFAYGQQSIIHSNMEAVGLQNVFGDVDKFFFHRVSSLSSLRIPR